ncbi:unnamed protein product [Chondrus crispus]|uniref:Uncharacterized protein n=1 Tax=Chondrus crispus TaxID=2769 RepID=R7Q2B9_CHOCR|nr:unnamed protein product [Chondrus crispus]CDF32199.1 unnamed protein product [Chondrus crispus]|eukprot:XP_005711864.1 unnamed protein product [Chondrus crispus]
MGIHVHPCLARRWRAFSRLFRSFFFGVEARARLAAIAARRGRTLARAYHNALLCLCRSLSMPGPRSHPGERRPKTRSLSLPALSSLASPTEAPQKAVDPVEAARPAAPAYEHLPPARPRATNRSFAGAAARLSPGVGTRHRHPPSLTRLPGKSPQGR